MTDASFSLFDKEDPRSLVNIVWPEFAERLNTFPKEDFYILNMAERDLRKKVKPDSALGMLRMRFWTEYDKAQTTGKKIKKSEVVGGICSDDYWKDLLRDTANIAYIVRPPPKYIAKMESLLHLAIDELTDILAMPNENEEGKPLPAVISSKIRIFELLDLRVKGAVLQKVQVDQRVLTKNMDAVHQLDAASLDSLEKGLKNIQKQITAAQNREVITIEATDSKENAEAIEAEVTIKGEATEVE